MLLVENPEIIFNFWYVHDEMGYIYSLRARAYIGIGTNDEKFAMLQEFAEIDYLIARPYPIPEQFHTTVIELSGSERLPVAHVNIFPLLDSPIALFEEAIKDIESNLPAQTKLKVSQTPITCVTPLLGDEEGEILPIFKDTQRFEQ